MARYSSVTYPKLRDKWVRILKQELERTRSDSKATLKDIGVVFDEYISKEGLYLETKKTKLYNNNGGEYCNLLEMLSYIDSEDKFEEVYEVIRLKSISTVYAVYYLNTEFNERGLIMFSNKDDGLSCFANLYAAGVKKNQVLYDTVSDYQKKYDKNIEDIQEKSLGSVKRLYKGNVEGKQVNFLYENNKISLINDKVVVI